PASGKLETHHCSIDMEVLISLCLVALATVLVTWLLKLKASSSGRSKAKQELPPGPWTLPIIGSLHHVLSLLPHRTITKLSRRHGPLMLLKLGEVSTVIVSSAEGAALVMKTNDLALAGRPCSVTLDIAGRGGKGLLFAPYGDHWRQMRKLCVVELLSSKQVKRMEGIRAKEVGDLVRSITASAGATVNISEMVAALSNDVISQAVFGGKFPQQEEYLRELDEVFRLLGGFCLVDLFPSSPLSRWLSNGERHMKRSCARIHQIIAEIIKGRKESLNPGNGATDDEDLLDVLLRLQEEASLAFPLTTDTIGAVLFDMFAAGTESTSTVLEWTMSELVIHPEAMAKAQQEDPTYWKNPEEFKPERFENNSIDYNGTYFEYTPFGSGRRLCPGMLFSTSTLDIVLANLLYHFNWILPDGASLDMSEKFGLTVNKRYDLKLRAVPHMWNYEVQS
uniref:Cytochrome P450 n=1 Tax=Aegilops tauschii subsp. strangulata TaxID=200361 RepID=A0A453A7N9_AEGTS